MKILKQKCKLAYDLTPKNQFNFKKSYNIPVTVIDSIQKECSPFAKDIEDMSNTCIKKAPNKRKKISSRIQHVVLKAEKF